MKNKCEYFGTLYIQSKKRIYQPKLLEMIKKKSKTTSVYFPSLVEHW